MKMKSKKIILLDEYEPTTRKALDWTAEQFNIIVKEAFDLACPPMPSLKRRPNKWWNSELTALRSEVKTIYKTKKTEEDNTKYKELRSQYRAAIKKAKKASWEEFCSNKESSSDLSRLMKALESKTCQTISLMQRDGLYTTTPEESMKELLTAHFIDSVEANEEEILDDDSPEILKELDGFMSL